MIIQTLKLFHTLNLIERLLLKKMKYTEKKAKKEAIKILNKKRKLKPIEDSDDEQGNFSDAETIPYVEPYRGTFTK